MKANVGGADKIFRLAAGIVIIGIGVYFQSWWGAIGIIPLATALINWCPIYPLVGISTAKKDG